MQFRCHLFLGGHAQRLLVAVVQDFVRRVLPVRPPVVWSVILLKLILILVLVIIASVLLCADICVPGSTAMTSIATANAGVQLERLQSLNGLHRAGRQTRLALPSRCITQDLSSAVGTGSRTAWRHDLCTVGQLNDILRAICTAIGCDSALCCLMPVLAMLRAVRAAGGGATAAQPSCTQGRRNLQEGAMLRELWVKGPVGPILLNARRP